MVKIPLEIDLDISPSLYRYLVDLLKDVGKELSLERESNESARNHSTNNDSFEIIEDYGKRNTLSHNTQMGTRYLLMILENLV